MAFNLAFESFGLPYHWGEDTYGDLLRITGGQRRLHRYLADQGVGEDERADLVPALHAHKTEVMTALVDDGRVEPRPGVTRLLGELQAEGCRLAVATTGSRGWVDRLLDRLLGDFAFDVVVTGDEVKARKPDPEAYLLAVERLGEVPARGEGIVAIEDSAEGLQAAQGAGLPCAVVVNGYTRDHDLATADLVLDGFGDPGHPARVLADRRATGCAGILDVAVLGRLLSA